MVVRNDVRDLKAQYDKTEDDLKAVQNVGQLVGEVLKQLDDERCKMTGWDHFMLSLRIMLSAYVALL